MTDESMHMNQMTAMYEVETMCRAEAWMKANLVPLVHKQRARVSEWTSISRFA